MEITINQNENQTITIGNNNIQNLEIEENENQLLNVENNLQLQNVGISQQDNQIIYIDSEGTAIGISDVLVNGVSVVTGNIAYITVPTKTSELQNNSGFITTETDPTVPSYVKAISLADINNWNNKQNALVSGSTIKTINNESLLGSGNIQIDGIVYTAGTGIDITNEVISNEITSYNDLTDLPTIPTKVSDLINDENFASENDLAEVAFTGSYVSLSDTPQYLSDFENDTHYVDRTSLNVAGTRCILVAMNIFKNDCSYDLLCVFNLVDYVILIKNTSAILIRSFVLKIKTKLIYCKNTIEKKSLICRKQFSIRI